MMLSRVFRAALLVGGCVVATAVAWQLCAAPMRELAHVASLELAALVNAGCACALSACVVWLVATTVLEVGVVLLEEAAPRRTATRAARRLGDRWSPRVTRRLVALALGVAVGGLAVPAAGADTGLGGLPLPDRTSGSMPAARAPRSVPMEAPTEVVVQPGDTLWSIASGFLDPAADGTEITAAWHRLHRRNVDRVGADPDLIRPGTRLVVPGSLAPRGKEAP